MYLDGMFFDLLRLPIDDLRRLLAQHHEIPKEALEPQRAWRQVLHHVLAGGVPMALHIDPGLCSRGWQEEMEQTGL